MEGWKQYRQVGRNYRVDAVLEASRCGTSGPCADEGFTDTPRVPGGKGANQAVAAAKVRNHHCGGRVGSRAVAHAAFVGWSVRGYSWACRRGRSVVEGRSRRLWSRSRLPSHRSRCTSLPSSARHSLLIVVVGTIWPSPDTTLDGNTRQLHHPPSRREPLSTPHLPRRLPILDNPPPE